jgi:hypothetical protein
VTPWGVSFPLSSSSVSSSGLGGCRSLRYPDPDPDPEPDPPLTPQVPAPNALPLGIAEDTQGDWVSIGVGVPGPEDTENRLCNTGEDGDCIEKREDVLLVEVEGVALRRSISGKKRYSLSLLLLLILLRI